MSPVLYMDSINKNKGGLEAVISLPLSKFPNMFRYILYSEIYHMANFDVLIQSGFKVIPKIAFPNLCKTYLVAIIIPLSNLHFEWKKLQKIITKNAISRERKELLRWNEKLAYYCFQGLSFGEI